VDDVVGPGEIEAHSAGLGGENQDVARAVGEVVDDQGALEGAVDGAVEDEGAVAACGEVGGEDLVGFHEGGEDQGCLVLLADGVEEWVEGFRLRLDVQRRDAPVRLELVQAADRRPAWRHHQLAAPYRRVTRIGQARQSGQQGHSRALQCLGLGMCRWPPIGTTVGSVSAAPEPREVAMTDIAPAARLVLEPA
jgi:hypothetical protein